MTATDVTVSNFEGPLGLLLELVERGQLEVTTIAVAAVTGQYLDRISQLTDLPVTELAQFVELGSRLIYIKSQALLPCGADENVDDGAEITKLRQELAEYRLLHRAGLSLGERLKTGRQSFPRRSVPQLVGPDLPLPTFELTALRLAFQRAIRQAPPLPERLSLEHHYSQQAIAEALLKRLTERGLLVSDITGACRDRYEIIVTFLAILELVRSAQVTVRQSRLFDDIWIDRAVPR